MHSICVWNMIIHSTSLQTRYNTPCTYNRCYVRTNVYAFLFSVEKTRVGINCEFDLEGDLVGVRHGWNLLGQSFITLLKLV